MYSINNIPLDNTAKGWKLLRKTQALTGVTKNLNSVQIPGRNGVLSGVPAFKSPPTTTLVIRTTAENLEALYALFEGNGGRGLFTLTGDTTRAAVFELASLSADGVNSRDQLVNVSATIRFPTADWRDTALTTLTSTSVTDPIQDFSILSGIGSDIADADIFIGGNFGNMELVDQGSGSWLKTILTWPNVADTGLLYVGSTGQAFRATTAAPWTPTADMSNYVDVSGGGGFRITPTWSSDPDTRTAKLKLTTTNQSGVTFRFRTYNAYSLRSGDV